MRRRARAFAVFVAGALASGSAAATGKILEAEPLHAAKITVDGLLREWPGKMTELGALGDPSGSVQLGYDDANLYCAFKIKDAMLHRTPAAAAGEDHGTLVIAFPRTSGGFVTREVELYPGVPGKLGGTVKLGGKPVAGAKIVEAPAPGGISFEAVVPWSALPEAATVRVGLRGALRYSDSDGAGTKTIQTASGSGASLPALRLEAEQALETSLLRPNSLPQRPSREALGDLVGDAMKERVGVWGKYLAIFGSRYKGGTQFYFRELGVRDASMVTRLELFEADGDGKQEILLQRRLGAPEQYREVLTVIKVGSNEQPYEALNHEIAIVTPDVKIENRVKLVASGKRIGIEIAQGTAEGADPASYAEAMPADMDPALLPWQSIGKKVYEWGSTAYVKSREEPWQPKLTAPGATGAKAARREQGPPPPPPPRPPTADELLDRVYALYRKDRGVGEQKPRFDFVTDVAGGRETERVLVHASDVVVFGKGFKGGTSYAFITLNVKDPKDVVHVDARDLTGDGKAEVLVRAVLPTRTSKELGGAVVRRHALVVYTVAETGLRRVFGAETGRELDGNHVLGAVAFLPAGRATAIELRADRALGWTEQSYPFPQDTLPAGGLEPLLLPWSESKQARYAFDGNGFVKR